MQQAEELYRAVLQVQPLHAEANHHLGVLAGQVGQAAAGLPYLKTALLLDPGQGRYALSYAGALLASGQAREALHILQTALQRGLDSAAARSLRQQAQAAVLGDGAGGAAALPAEIGQLVALFDAGRYAELESRARALLERHADSGTAWKVLGLALQAQGKASLPALHKAANLLPGDAEAHLNLGNALQDLGQFDDAVAAFRRALDLKPGFAKAHYNLGNALRCLYRLEEAAASYRRALAFDPDLATAHCNLGIALQDLGQVQEAVASYGRALALEPGLAEAHINLGIAFLDLGQLEDAAASYRRALAIQADFAAAHNNLGLALQASGEFDAAVASFRRALEIRPDYADAYSNLLFLYAHRALIAPEEYLAQARGWERVCVPAQERAAARSRVFARPPLAGRRLRIGYVSGDFRLHAVSYYLEPLFVHHDRTRIELFAYSTQGKRDAVTARLQALADHWIPVMGMSDAAIRDRIEADGIDVLVDCSGHTAHHGLGFFARRAAPVQVYYIGYFASTGLTEMDYLIGDDVLTPPATDNHYSERVWRLPRIWESYNDKVEAPLPAWRPAENGSLWLGSFNNLGKLTPATLALWAQALHALPEARLLLKAKEFSESGNRRRILAALSGCGIASDRIELQDGNATPQWRDHMAYYDRLDVALDPVGGMGGGNTTCDALWMGVPVITLEGDRLAARVTDTILHAVGHPEWIARSEAEYVAKVAALARDVQARAALRSRQRRQMAASPLCDARGLAAVLESAYYEMFQRWFDAQQPTPAQG